MTPDIKRRNFHAVTLAAWAMATTVCALSAAQAQTSAQAQPQAATAWGWPQPYMKVSDKSIAWLKDKGWLPLMVGWQPPFAGQNTMMAVMNTQGLLAKRGLDAKFQAFNTGAAMNEVFASGRVQVGSAGNFPLNSLIDKGIPTKVIATIAPNLRHEIIVPLDSPLKKISDFKGGRNGEPYVIGIPTGSSSEFYFQMATGANGVVIGKDVTLKNMPPAELALMPKGIDAVVPWDYTNSLIIDERKSGRPIDVSYAYNIYQGSVYVRQELVDNVPDVARAITEAVVESTLWIRTNPAKAVDAMLEEPNLKNVPRGLLTAQVAEYNNLYKPTYVYPLADFWTAENEKITGWLFQNKRLRTANMGPEFKAAFAPQFMDAIFKDLGWKIPTVPPTLPANWAGKIGQLPYPAYDTVRNMKQAQTWPEAADLTKPFTFNGVTVRP